MGIVSNSEFARYAGCDRSYISRIRSGGRIIAADSRAAKRLVRSVYTCAVEKETIGQVCALIDCPSENSPYEIQNAIAQWLFRGENGGRRQGARLGDRTSGSFANRLNDVMNLAELSNVRLARLANVDASVISRYRRGQRSPGSNSYILESICRTLFSRIVSQGRLDNLCELTGLSKTMLSNDDIAADIFRSWLSDSGTDDTVIIESFLEGIDSFVPDYPAVGKAMMELVGSDILSDDSAIYVGADGLRKAAARFMATAISKGAGELWLYIERSFDWLSDEDFAKRWSALLGECVSAGVHIKIIHNIDRNLEEMVFSVKNWLPFYVSGMIESYYSTKSAGERFTHLLFLAPGVACLSSCNAAGWDQGARYSFYTGSDNLAYFQEQYERLLSDCRTLIRLERGKQVSTQLNDTGGIYAVRNTFNLGSMPEELLNRILRRVLLPNGQEEELRAEWRSQREFYRANAEKSFIRECIAFPSQEAIAGGRVPVDTSAALIMYTPDELKEHTANILRLLEEYPKYELFPLDEIPFEHIRIIVSSKSAVVRRTDIASNELCVSHPLMRMAFVSYAEQLQEQCTDTRQQCIERLKEYL